jgi:transcriptional regulator GlxA family with amidase domain
MMSLSSAIEPLRSANRLMNKALYSWTLASLDGNPVHASNGIELQAQKLDDVMARAQYIFVCGGLRLDPTLEPEYLRALRRAACARRPAGGLPVHDSLGKPLSLHRRVSRADVLGEDL